MDAPLCPDTVRAALEDSASWDLLDEDAYQWFVENGGLTRRNGDRFRNLVLAPGGQTDFAQIFRDFRGRDPVAGPLLKSRGLDRK